LALPFSDAVLVGNTLYLSGHIGLAATTGVPPGSAEDEARLAMDGIKQTVELAGFSMDDVVSIQIFCTDLTRYDTFNGVCKTYVHGDHPARDTWEPPICGVGDGMREWGLRQKERSSGRRSTPVHGIRFSFAGILW
jgi:enamine deaminase RidA (YjgF/YER057c/UK114 family)